MKVKKIDKHHNEFRVLLPPIVEQKSIEMQIMVTFVK